jgi:Transposase IS200 like
VLKANSSRWLRKHGLDFSWQEGYGAFSVSSSNLDVVKQYIERQGEHHREGFAHNPPPAQKPSTLHKMSL